MSFPSPTPNPNADQPPTIGSKLRPSRYLQSKQLSPTTIGVYSPFGHEFVFLATDAWKGAQHGQTALLSPDAIKYLCDRGFLVEDGFEESVLRQYLPPPEHIREMWLVVEQACNMACQYCVTEGNVEDPDRRVVGRLNRKSLPIAPAQSKAVDTMSVEVASAAISRFSEYLKVSKPPFPRVTLYGGEPLLNWPVLKAAIPQIRSISYPGQIRENPVQALIITNGQILTEEMLEFFVEHEVAVSVSLDGRAEHHDAVRTLASGSGTHQRAVQTLRRYKDAGLKIGICTTIGTHNAKDLPEIADYFADEFECAVEFQVPFQIPYNGGNKYSMPMVDAAPYALEAFERLRSRGLLEGLAGRRLYQVQHGKFHHRDCSAVGGQWVVAPDGSVGPCHALTGQRAFFKGNVLDERFDPWDNPAFHEWSRRQPVNMPDCHGCSAIAICGGGCGTCQPE